jgi:hypothetical protein
MTSKWGRGAKKNRVIHGTHGKPGQAPGQVGSSRDIAANRKTGIGALRQGFFFDVQPNRTTPFASE